MIELEPVNGRRVFVPSPGDSVKVCPECGSQTGILHASAKWLKDIDKEVYEHVALNYTTCCGVTPTLREVPMPTPTVEVEP